MGLRPTPIAVTLRCLSAVLIVALMAACAGKKELVYKEESVYDIYSKAMLNVERENYTEGALYFDEVERQHPYSVWAIKAKLMAAYSYYHSGEYDEAITRLDRFISVHPGNRDVAYAYYLKAICYYERIADIRRDQEFTTKALETLQDIVTRFPDTSYGRDARLKLDLTRDHLAGREMSVGRFYLSNRQHLAAINRFRGVIEQFGSTTHAPEALYRLVESFTALGLRTEAMKAAAVLGYNFPTSDWYHDAYALTGGVKAAELAAAATGKPLASDSTPGSPARSSAGPAPKALAPPADQN
jgi:outer membrane protein assembly factor BamD